MFDFSAILSCDRPYRHWVGRAVPVSVVQSINEEWPADKSGWMQERGRWSHKDSLLFPRRLPDAAQRLAEYMYSPVVCATLSYTIGMELVPDPWFLDGPERPALGGGLHEILPGGLLKMHVDFNRHPSGLVRCVNLLIYLNLDWAPEWGGGIELMGATTKVIMPTAGMTVLFETTADSWHGHPHPLACPADRTRRSLALYYYTRGATADRDTTVYKK